MKGLQLLAVVIVMVQSKILAKFFQSHWGLGM